MSKRILSILLALTMVLAIAPVSVFAEDDVLSYLTYEINDGEVTITYCDESISGEVVIPDTIEGCPVTAIGSWAFSKCTSLESITIPDSVTLIGNYAFYNCTSLESITIPDRVTSIDNGAFSKCTSLENITIPDSVTSIVCSAFDDTAYYNDESNWENGVLYIGKHLIIAKTDITECEIKDETLTIANSAFCDRNSLTNVIIPDSVTTIGSYAFSSCTSLENITIPDSVTSIGEDVFDDCTSLTSITVSEDNKYYSSDEYGVLFNKAKTKLIQYPIGKSRTEYTIPDSVTFIGAWAFDNCTSLTSVTIPDSVTTINEGAFYACDSLENIAIPDSVTSIAPSAFCYCNSLKSMTILNPECIIYDSEYTIYNSQNTISTNATIYGCSGSTAQKYADKYSRTFVAIDNYTSVVTAPTCTEQGYTTYTCTVCGESFADDYVLATGHTKDSGVVTTPTCTEQGYTTYTCTVCGKAYDDDYVYALGHTDENADSKCDVCGNLVSTFNFNIGDAKVGETVEVTIGTDFDKFEVGSLQINFEPEYLKYVSYRNIFRVSVVAGIPSGCTQEDGILNVGMLVLENLTETKDFITLEFEVLKTGSSTLSVKVSDWSADTMPANASITINVHEHDYTEIITNPTCAEHGYTTYTCSICGDSYIDNYIDASYEYHAYDAVSVTEATCSEFGYTTYTCTVCGDTYDGNYEDSKGHTHSDGDMYCDVCGEYALEYTILDSGEVQIWDCHLTYEGELVIPSTIDGYPVTDIQNLCSYVDGNKITSVYIPESVVSVHIGVFDLCPYLEYVTVDENNAYYTADENGVLYNKDKTVLVEYPSVSKTDTYTIPDSVTIIEAYAFVCCNNLKNVIIPETVTEIGEGALGYYGVGKSEEFVEDFTIYGYTGSASEVYANEYNIKFVALCKHDTTVTKNIVQATCSADGYTGDVYCEACDELLTKGEVTPALGHKEEVIPEVPATYTETGLTEGKKCSVCNEILVAQEVIPMLEIPSLTPSTENITVTDTVAASAPEMSVEDIIKSVENENVLILDKDGKAIASDAFVGTGSKIQVLDKDGKVLSEYEVMVKSDVDGNGKVTPADARLALRASAKLDKIEGVFETAANYDDKDKVSTSDARMILRKAAGLEK